MILADAIDTNYRLARAHGRTRTFFLNAFTVIHLLRGWVGVARITSAITKYIVVEVPLRKSKTSYVLQFESGWHTAIRNLPLAFALVLSLSQNAHLVK